MRTGVFAVYDRATEAFMQPFYSATAGAAIRSFSDAVNNPESNFHRHPEDFMLSQLGTFDDASGEIECAMPPKKLITALEVKEANDA